MDKLKHVFRPGGESDDAVLYGTPEPKGVQNPQTQQAAGSKTDPGSEKYNIQQSGETGQQHPGTTLSQLKEKGGSAMSVKSGVHGPYAGQADRQMAGDGATSGVAGQSLPDRSTQGAATAGTGASGYEAGSYSTDPSKTAASQQQERAFPLGGGTTTHPASDPASTSYGQTSQSDYPSRTERATQQPSTRDFNQPDYGRDAALAGGAGAGAGALRNEASKPRDDSSYAPTSQGGHPSSTQGTTQQPSTAASREPEYGRHAALAGGAGLGAGALGYEATRARDDKSRATNPDQSYPVGTATSTTGNTSSPSFPDPVTAARTARQETGTTDLSGTSQSTDPYSSSQATQQTPSGGNSHLGRDTALAGAGAAGAGALGYEASRPKDDDISGATYADRSSEVGGHHPHEAPAEGYVHHTKGPHSLDIANRLDPHVPGEFPDDSGFDRHAHHGREDAGIGGAAAGTAGIGAASYGAGQSRDDPSSTLGGQSSAPTAAQGYQPRQQEHHYGRDAALAGGVGAAGVGAYELSKDETPAVAGSQQTAQPQTGDLRDLRGSSTTATYSGTSDQTPTSAQAYDSAPQQTHHYGRDAALAGGAGAAGVGAYELGKDNAPAAAGDSRNTGLKEGTGSSTVGAYDGTRDQAPTSAQVDEPTQRQHHYGRDAALAGGAGAAGAGAYEATKDRGDTGPASQTVGPHDSNVANIVDPRVQPSKDTPTTDPLPKSGAGNTTDSRIESSARQAPKEEQHHYGRDAAIAGGAGAAGVGAYELGKDHDKDAAAAEVGKHEPNKLHKRNDPRGHPDSSPYATSGIGEKHERDLQKARDAEAAKGGDHGEKKEGFLHKLLHPGHKDKEQDKHADEKTAAAAAAPAAASHHHQQQPAQGLDQAQRRSHHVGIDGAIGDDHAVSGHPHQEAGNDQYRIDPHTGLPMNIGKYGEGAGGTDGAQQIHGYHETEDAVAHATHGTAEHGHQPGQEGTIGPDWDKIKKANTPY